MNQLQTKNPQAYQTINQAINSGANPQEFMKQMMGNVNANDMQQILQMGQQLGVPDTVLQQVQNMK